MPEVTRRRLLSSAAVGAGGALASSLLPPALARAAAEGPRRGSLRDVKHVVIHMQENRSFDHYFGTLAGVARLRRPERADPDRHDAAVQHGRRQVDLLPVRPEQPRRLPAAVASRHARARARRRSRRPRTRGRSSTTSLNITVGATSGAPTTALNNNWIPSHFTADGAANYWYVMGYYERQDIPFHFALAETFTLCDHYHCSLLGPTWPNRMYLMDGDDRPERRRTAARSSRTSSRAPRPASPTPGRPIPSA